MKTYFKKCIITYCLFGASLHIYSQGYIIPNGISLNPGGTTGQGSMVTVIQNPVNGDYTGFNFKPQGADTFLLSFFADEGVRTFLVSPNNPISLQAILSQNYTEIDDFFGGPSYQTFTEGVPFYLGFYTGYNPWDAHGTYTGIYSNPVFGWGEFVNNAGVIQMLDSALEIEGGGIYAGTKTIIPAPEPSTFALVALGGLLLGCRRWKN